MRTVCIIQARMGSKRLPGKVLLPLNGHTVIEEVVSRCQRIPGVDMVAVTTPDLQVAYTVSSLCSSFVCGYGDENNVLARYAAVAKETQADIIVRVTGDCPLISPELCGEVLARLKSDEADYASNVTEPRSFPQGYDCEVFTRRTLDRAVKHGPDEHVTTWMRRDPYLSRAYVRAPWMMEGRLTLDTEDDYRTICAYFGHEPYQHLRAA